MQTQPPFQARWIIGTMAIMRSVKSKKTYKEWFTALIKLVTKNKHWNSDSIGFICDTFRLISSKSCTHTEMGESGKQVCLKSKYQNMMSGKDWRHFSQYRK